MQQYFAVSREKEVLKLNYDDFNHIKNVMRMKKGDNVIAVHDNVSYICVLRDDLISCDIKDVFKTCDEYKSFVAYVPLLQEDKMGLILQKGTELGVTEFVVVMYNHCKYKLSSKDYEKKLIRWNKIVKEASEQCYRINKPKINKIITLDKIEVNTNVNILCSLVKHSVKHISDILNENNASDTISVAFGPEGGFSLNEEEILVSKGFERASLGPNVLRTETVLIYFASVLMYLKGSVQCGKNN